jgi:hypothetical protein
MSFLDHLKHAVLGEESHVSEESSPPALGVQGAVDQPAEPSRPTKNDDKADFRLLVSLFQNQRGQDIDYAALVKQVNPTATPSRCPYCGAVHPFTASRARKCPACSRRMVVRQGHFLTEDQARQMQDLVQEAYRKQSLLTRIGVELESAQNNSVEKRKVEYLGSLANAFRFTAQIENRKDERGYSFWDKAWGYYNQARVEEMRTLTRESLCYNRLPDLHWDMTQMLYEQARTARDNVHGARQQKRALVSAFSALAEAASFDADPYFKTDLYKLAKGIIDQQGIAPDEVGKMASDAAIALHVSENVLSKYRGWVQDLMNYQIIEPFRA